MTKQQWIEYVEEYYECVEDAEAFVEALLSALPMDQAALEQWLSEQYPCIDIEDFIFWMEFDGSGNFVGPRPHRPPHKPPFKIPETS